MEALTYYIAGTLLLFALNCYLSIPHVILDCLVSDLLLPTGYVSLFAVNKPLAHEA
jgi:hypothetical protein